MKPRAAFGSVVASTVFALLDPIPFGCFVAALVFDVVYLRTADIQWDKCAAWLITVGLFFAIIPRLVNLVQVWITSRNRASGTDRLDFWLNLLAIIAAIFNAFVHTRDAYAVVPAGVWLSIATVALMSVAHIVMTTRISGHRESGNE